MSYPVSTVPAVFTYLLATLTTAFAGATNPTDIYLCMGDPGEQAPPDIIEITGVQRTTPHFAMVGDGETEAQEEIYQVMFRVSSAMRGDTQATIAPLVQARAWYLLGLIETAVRTDPSLGGIVLTAWPGQSNGGVPVWSANGNGMICEIESSIEVENVF